MRNVFALQGFIARLHSHIAHLIRLLYHQKGNDTIFHQRDLVCVRIKTAQNNIRALHLDHHIGNGSSSPVVGAVNPLYFRMRLQDIHGLRSALCGVITIVVHRFQAGDLWVFLFTLFYKTLNAVKIRGACSRTAKQCNRTAFFSQDFRHMIGGFFTGRAVIRHEGRYVILTGDQCIHQRHRDTCIHCGFRGQCAGIGVQRCKNDAVGCGIDDIVHCHDLTVSLVSLIR